MVDRGQDPPMSPTAPTAEALKALLRGALKEAMRARRAEVVSVLRELLGALDNAEAVEAGLAPKVEAGVIAGGVTGLGAGEVPRRVLSREQVKALIARELDERRQAVATYQALGRADEVARLEAQLEAVEAVLASRAS